MATADDFDRDFDAYQRELPRLIDEAPGQFALVGRAELAGVFSSRDAAMEAGYERFGLRGFLVQEVNERDLETGPDAHTCRR